jgi:hypothetical protein
MVKITQSQQLNTVTTDTNPGSAGGSRNYVNLGGIKYCWGATSTLSLSASSQTTGVITWPASFFSSAPAVTLAGIPSGTVQLQAHLNNSPSTTNVTVAVDATAGATTGGMIIHWMAIGV